MSTSLATLTPPTRRPHSGLDKVAPVKPSYIKFLQPSSNNLHGGRPGQFLDESTGELYDSMVVVPLDAVDTRVFYAPGSAFGGSPLCKSDDGVVPSPFIQLPQSKTCATCSQSVWPNGRPSACNSNIKLLAILKDIGMPRFIVASGTSVSPLRTMLRRINENSQIANMKPGSDQINLYDYFFTIGSEPRKNWFMMTFTDVKRVANPGEFGYLYERFVSSFAQDAKDEAEAAIDTEIIPEM